MQGIINDKNVLIGRGEQEKLMEVVRRCKGSLVESRRLLLMNGGDEKPAGWYHHEWSKILLEGEKNYAIEGFRNSGKALSLNTEIPTQDGFKLFSDIHVGDVLFGSDGHLCKVSFESNIMYEHKCFKVTLSDGINIICDAEHLWKVYDKKKRKYRIVTTEEISKQVVTDWNKFEYRYRIDNCKPVLYSKKNLEVNPYLLGLWLGDGSTHEPDITIGDEDYDELSLKIFSLWNDTKIYAYKNRSRRIRLNNGFRQSLNKIGVLHKKHIPDLYLRASIKQRMELLRGLMDSDGSVGGRSIKHGKRGICNFCSTNKNLALDTRILIHSLGIKTTLREKDAKLYGRIISKVYTIEFETQQNVFSLKRKLQYLKSESVRSSARSIVSVLPTQSVPVKCIKVDSSDSLFLITQSFLPTHNTQYIIRTFPLYCLMYPSRRRQYLVLICNNTETARKKLRETETEYLENDLLRQRLVTIIEESADVFCVKVLDDDNKEMIIRIEAYGKGKAIRGLAYRDKRPDIVVMDDLQDENDAMSETILENDWTWFRSEVGFLGRFTRFVMLANNLGEKCIVERIASEPDSFGFIFMRIPIINDEGTPAWPEMFSKEFIDEERERYIKSGDFTIWQRNRMCVAVSRENQVFKRDDLRWYVDSERKSILERCLIYISCDWSGTAKKTSDYTAFPVIGVDEDDYWYLLDVRFGKWDGPEQMKQLFSLVREYRPHRVGIEMTGQHGGLIKSTIVKTMTEEKCMFTLAEIVPDGKLNKEERIERALGQRVRVNKLILPESASYLEEVLTELLMFTRQGAKSRYDDVIDAIAQFDKFAKAPISKKQSQFQLDAVKNLPRSSIASVYVK